VISLLLFVYVFGGRLGNGLGGVSGGRAEYANTTDEELGMRSASGRRILQVQHAGAGSCQRRPT
jgi:hypothetical protein